MVNHDRWRDQQLRGIGITANLAVLPQEKVMLDFVCQHNIAWKWLGIHTEFKEICQRKIRLSDSDYQGVILFGPKLMGLTTSQLISKIKTLVGDLDYAYVGINRYEILRHDFDLALPDSIEETMDTLMHQCNPNFVRLAKFEHVDGNHMVAAHPMDCYGLCNK
jgi:hypothetical protein